MSPPAIDAAVAARGGACGRDLACAPGLDCVTNHYAFGGYCASACGETCDGTCVGTPRGELCMAACTTDRDCRAAEGYVCDPSWRACVMPNSTAIVPRTCPAPRGIGRNPGFAPTTQLARANESSAVVLPDGGVVALHADAEGALGLARIDAQGRPPTAAPFVATAPATAPPPSAIPVAVGTWPSLARDAGGTLYAAWQAGGVRFAASRDGTTWSAPRALDACTTCRAVVVTGAGAVHVVIASEGIRVRTSRDGGKTFGAAVTALAGGYGNATVGADGRLHVIGIEGGPLGAYGSANQRVQYTVSATGGRSFARAITVSRRDEMVPFYFANPSVAVDTRRRWLYVAYVVGGRDAVWDIVLAASKDGGKTWTRRRIGDDPPCAIHMVPNLTLDPRTGKLHVAWYDARGGGRFAHATCTPGLAACRQLGRIDDEPFAVPLSTVRGHAGWLGDAASLVVDDKRRVLHAVWTRPTPDGPRVVHAKAKLPLR